MALYLEAASPPVFLLCHFLALLQMDDFTMRSSASHEGRSEPKYIHPASVLLRQDLHRLSRRRLSHNDNVRYLYRLRSVDSFDRGIRDTRTQLLS
jgi:hypothetical protein